MSRASVVVKARQPFWVNGFPQSPDQIFGNPSLCRIFSSGHPPVPEGNVFFNCSRVFAVVPPGAIKTIHQVNSEPPRPYEGKSLAFRSYTLSLGDLVWSPASIAAVERVFPYEGLAYCIQNLPLNDSDLTPAPPTITYATILPYEPPITMNGETNGLM